MVHIKDVQVILQTSTSNQWRACEEFDSLETLGPSANSATRQTVIVECEPGIFGFVLTLTQNFEWSDKANAIKINLTFDGGDPLGDYEVVVLKPGADGNDFQELGLKYFMSKDTGESTHCLETICMPLTVEDPSSPWLKAGFEFGRYFRAPASFGHNAPSSADKGNLRVDVVQCTVKRNPRRNPRIVLAPKLDPNWRSLPPANNVTLKPELRCDPSRARSAYCHYKCKPIPGIQHVSFIFLYREAGHYEKIEKEDIDVVEDEVASTSKAGRGLKKILHTPRSNSTSYIRPSLSTATREPRVAPDLSAKSTPNASAASRKENIQLPHLNTPAPSTLSSDSDSNRRHFDIGDGRLPDDQGLIFLLERTTEMLPQIEDMGQKGDNAERAFVQKKLQQAIEETNMAQKALDNCKSEVDKWRDKDERITKRLHENSQQELEDESEKEERKIHGEAEQAIQKLFDARRHRLERRKRRVSQWSIDTASPTREAKRAR